MFNRCRHAACQPTGGFARTEAGRAVRAHALGVRGFPPRLNATLFTGPGIVGPLYFTCSGEQP